MRINNFLKIHIVLLLFILPDGAMAYSYGDPTPAEQAHLEAINRARANPHAEAARLGIDLFEGVSAGEIDGNPQPPLTLNATLSDVAKTHSDDMVVRNYFSHDTLEGVDPFGRITNAGYEYQSAGENIANMFDTRDLEAVSSSLQLHDNLFIDEGVAGRGHRVNILSPNFKEVGIGLAGGQQTHDGTLFNTFYITTDFATAMDDERSFVLGVVYDDQDGDGFYTAGEGIGDVIVTVVETGEQTTTASAGGYALPLADGQYTLKFSLSPEEEASRSVTMAGNNVKIDVTDFHKTTQTPPISSLPTETPLEKFPHHDLQSVAVNNEGQSVDTAASIHGGISVNDSVYQQQVVQNLSDPVDVRGEITIDSAHVGQQADIFVYAEATLPPDTTIYYFMLDGNYNIFVWDQQPENLIAFTPNITLTNVETVPMYSGQFIYPGTLKVYFGYRLQDGTVIFNLYPIDITIND